MALRTIPIRRSLHRPNLLLGGERELVLMTGLVAFVCVFSALNLAVGLFGLGVWFGVIGLLRQMAKSDPRLSQVYLRHIRYRTHYAPRATPWLRER